MLNSAICNPKYKIPGRSNKSVLKKKYSVIVSLTPLPPLSLSPSGKDI